MIADGRPFKSCRITGPAATTKPAAFDLRDDFFRIHFPDALLQRIESAVGHVFVDTHRVNLAVILRCDVFLPAEEISDRLVPNIDRMARHRLGLFIGQDRIKHLRNRVGDSFLYSVYLEMPQDNGSCILRLDMGIKKGFPVRRHNFQQRRLVTHADASHTLDLQFNAGIGQSFFQSIPQFAAAASNAA